MILRLIARDPAWKIALVLAVPAWVAPQIPGIDNPLLALSPVVLLGSLVNPQRRATLLEVSLPISARDLFLARLLSMLALVWFPFLTGELAFYAATRWSVGLLECAALMTLLILLPLAARVERPACPVWMVAVVWIDGIAAGWAGLHFLPPAVFLTLCAVAVTAVFLRTWVAIPPSFQVAPLEAVSQRSGTVKQRATAPVWRIFARFALPWWYLPLGMAVLVQSFLGGWWWFWAWICSTLMYSLTRSRTRWLEALPVPRRALLLVALIPMAFPVLIGAGLGSTIWHVDQRRAGTPNVEVPVRFWSHAPGGVPPVLKAPWGETAQPATVTVLGYAFYNPYTVGPQNSARFLDWQYEQALERVYHKPPQPTDLAVARPAGSPGMLRPSVQILFVAAFFLLALYSAWLDELNNGSRLSRPSLWRRVAPALEIFWVIYFVLPPWPVLSLGIAAHVPDNPAVLVALAAIPVLLVLLLLDWQVRRSDQPPALQRPSTS
jgi:hypothetical protein